MTDVVLYEVSERIATVTLHRPAVRNALSSDVLRLLPDLLQRAEDDTNVDVIILTGSDPAFCAGLDLKELGSSARLLGGTGADATGADGSVNASGVRGPFPRVTKPLIGAINGVAVTGGFELALHCDFLVASERASFADTHARVGVMPGWGLTVLLPKAIGVRRAREMSLTGNFMGAHEALACGLVNHVVPHEELLAVTRRLALDIIGNDQPGVRQMKATYTAITADPAGWTIESDNARVWRQERFRPETVAERRAALQERGRSQVG